MICKLIDPGFYFPSLFCGSPESKYLNDSIHTLIYYTHVDIKSKEIKCIIMKTANKHGLDVKDITSFRAFKIFYNSFEE